MWEQKRFAVCKRGSYENLLLNVEIKDINYEIVDATVKMLKEYGLSDRSVIACFDADIIRYTKRAYPEIALCALRKMKKH